MRIAALIDGAHLHSCGKALAADIDYRRLLDWLRARGDLVRASYYTVTRETNDEYQSLRPLLDWLQYNGYSLITKAGWEIVGRDNRVRIKGSIDVEMSVDIVTAARDWRLEEIMLFSGNGDLTYAVERAQQAGVRVSVVSLLAPENNMIADELRRQADEFVNISSIFEDIRRIAPRPPRRGMEEGK